MFYGSWAMYFGLGIFGLMMGRDMILDIYCRRQDIARKLYELLFQSFVTITYFPESNQVVLNKYGNSRSRRLHLVSSPCCRRRQWF